jgi:hypothetical protein
MGNGKLSGELRNPLKAGRFFRLDYCFMAFPDMVSIAIPSERGGFLTR